MTALWPWLTVILTVRKRLLLGALLMLATVLAGIGLLSLSGWFITATGMTAVLWAAGNRIAFDVYLPGGGIRFFALTRTVSRYLERLYNHDTVLDLLARLRLRLFANLAGQSLQQRQRFTGVDWLSRLTADVDALDNLYLRLLAPLLVAVLGTVLVSAMIALLSPLLAVLVGLLLLLTVLLITLGLARLTLIDGRARTIKLAELRAQAVANLEGMAELQAAGVVAERMAQLLHDSDQLTAQHDRIERRIAQAQGVMVLGTQLAVVLCFLTLLMLLEMGSISAPWAMLLPLALLGLSEAYTGLPLAYGYWGHTVAAAERLNAMVPTEATGAATGTLSGALQTLRWRQLDLGYQGESLLLSISSGELQPGEWLGITAPSGGGKSTFADRLAGVQALQGGQRYWGSQSLAEVSEENWLQAISYLPQRSHLFNDTLRANLLLANPQLDDGQLWWALEGCGLAAWAQALPEGLDTLLGVHGQSLSGGEQRRLLLACTLLKPSRLVILDEPFSGLDPATIEVLRERLPAMLQGRSLLALGHDASALPTVHRLLRL